ncbi:glycosyltransferase family 39 protein [Patescibacteria group bacterium]|nr:glycosyltransferase family 39 protein [Patescibacteria group bacterium]MBU4023003.1 glycosyltransferase family 39 protein [Patescibacteria group bacterium]MBU4162197.1 glycosyltransferase family 39 protein [Patescibacteria group bacterium]
MKLTNKTTNIIAIILLGACFLMAFLSSRNMSLTMDEKAHIPSGYSYLAFMDYRLNPEHPPLAKDLAALPLLFLDLNFPTEHKSWTEDINGQWDSGSEFIFNSGNDPDQIIFWTRLPMMILLVFLAWFLFFWVKKIGGNKAGLMALALFSFSPTFLAHGRLVTTDVAAVLGFLIATYFWVNFLKNPTRKNVFIAGIILGIALCLKFSLILLIPSFALITIVYALLSGNNHSKNKLKSVLSYIGKATIAGIIALVFVIWPIYQFHILNYPIEKQVSDTQHILGDQLPARITAKAASIPILRPVAQYALGLLMATQRVAGGNTVYFLGEVNNQAWKEYFPTMYLLKAPLAFHILTLIVLALWLIFIRKFGSFKKSIKRSFEWTRGHIAEFSLLVILIVYWFTSIIGNLNIGVRHILPVFPIMYIFISVGFFRLTNELRKREIKIALNVVMAILMLWYIIASLAAFPHYISYYNELAGGSENGYKYAVDSNYDWGQDLKRLADFVEKNNIEGINVSYFGGDNPSYRLGDKLIGTSIYKDPADNKGWIAISATFLQEGRAKAVAGFKQNTTGFEWLNNFEPVGRAGYSIFIYNIP